MSKTGSAEFDRFKDAMKRILTAKPDKATKAEPEPESDRSRKPKVKRHKPRPA